MSDEKKPREFWINQWESLAGADLAWRHPENAQQAYLAHQVYVKTGSREQMETIHVIEYLAYEAAMLTAEQITKRLSDEIIKERRLHDEIANNLSTQLYAERFKNQKLTEALEKYAAIQNNLGDQAREALKGE